MRIGVCLWLWPREWLGSCSHVCRSATDFLARREIRISLVAALPESAFTLTSPLWKLLRHAVLSRALGFMSPAFAAMGMRSEVSNSDGRGGRARLLGRCFALAAQHGFGELVRLAIKCGAEVDLRINGRSALDHAAQRGHVDIVSMLLSARASPAQTAVARWTPLMYASLGGHVDVCECLLRGGAPLDEHTERSTALDVAEANGHIEVADKLKSWQASRYLELRPGVARHMNKPLSASSARSSRETNDPRGSAGGRSSNSGRLRPGPACLGGGLPRGVLMGSVSLRLAHLEDDSAEEDENADHQDRVVEEEEEDIGSRLQRRFDLTLTPSYIDA